MKVKDELKKQGGFKLILQYIRSGTFLTAINQFLILGKSKTGLEILRLSTKLKLKRKLEKKYIRYIETGYATDTNHPKQFDGVVWFCWFQGLESAPNVVKKCYNSLKKNLDREIIVITEENFNEYVSLPDYIVKKYKKGRISKTHLSDILRLELLTNYGGTWVDSTVLCTEKEKNIPDFYLNSDLFMYQNLKPGKDGNATYISSWFITSKPNNKILVGAKNMLYTYWKKNNYQKDYNLIHLFISIAIDHYKSEWQKVVQIDNSLPHILLLNSEGKVFNEKAAEAAKQLTPFHKLTYKKELSLPESYYE